MIELVVIADDFTGALDTGIKFAGTGAKTSMFIGADIDFDTLSAETEIVIVDTETRHRDPADSYRIVYDLVSLCRQNGVLRYYKKTDSALRGCIGAELAALSDALNESVHFIPALPSENRYTENGVHYIDGTPVSKSVFGNDPFEPVRFDAITDIIGEQADVCVINVNNGNNIACRDEGNTEKAVFAYDARTLADLEQIADYLRNHDCLKATAGCSGFARVLQKMLPLNDNGGRTIERKDGMFAVCGSINEVTLSQIKYAADHGFELVTLSEQQKLMPDYFKTEEGMRFLNELESKCRGERPVIVNVDPGEKVISKDDQCVRDYGLDEHGLRERITERLGEIAEFWLDLDLNHVLIMSGGDTAYGFLKRIGVKEVTPICEVWQGSVLFSIMRDQKPLYIVAKSGGFGDQEFFIKAESMLTNVQER